MLQAFGRFHLTEQVRAGSDLKHSSFVKRLSDGNVIMLQDILSYKHLSLADVESATEDWKYAPVLVSTNLERLNITRSKCQLWARERGTYVFKWKCSTSRHVNKPGLKDYQKAEEENSFFWQYWVEGAPANLSHNINGDVALVNGSPVTLHSLTFQDIAAYDKILAQLQGPHPPTVGSEIEIDVPLAVNVVVDESLDGKIPSRRRMAQLEELRKISLPDPQNQGRILLPLTTSMSPRSEKDADSFFYKTGNVFRPLATVTVSSPMPYDIGFAMTVHKAQGRTLDRVVVDLTNHGTHYSRMKFAAVFVAMSRVRKGCDIRLLAHKEIGQKHDPVMAYEYLCDLRPLHEAAAFCHGFSREGDPSPLDVTWNFQRALSYKTV